MQAEKGRTHNHGRKDAHTQIKGMYAWEEGGAFTEGLKYQVPGSLGSPLVQIIST